MHVQLSTPAQHPVVTIVDSNGNPVDLGGGGGTGNIETIIQAADVTISTTTLGDITGLSFAIAANETVNLALDGFSYSVDTGTGVGFGVSGPASPTYARFTSMVCTGTTAVQFRASNGFGAIGAAALTAAATGAPGFPYRVTGTIVNGANAGTVQIQMRSEVATFAVVSERGSSLKIRRGT